MGIKIGIANEGFKYSYGLFSTSPKISGPKDRELFENTKIRFCSCKGDWAAFQLAVQSTEDFTLSVGKRPVFSPQGNLLNLRAEARLEGISSSVIEMYPIGLVYDDDGSLKADILLQDEVVIVENERLQMVWVEIRIPENTAEGTYKGKVHVYAQRMFEAEVEIETLLYEIVVKNVLMPEPGEYTFHLDLWQHPSNIARKHEVKLWSEEHFNILEHYIESLASLGQKAVSIIASEIPWSGQGCFRVKNYLSDLFEYNMIGIEKDGSFRYDFSNMARYIRLCFKYGIDSEIEVFGLINIWTFEAEGYGKVIGDYPDAIRVRYLDRKDNCYKYMNKSVEIIDYVKAVEKFFIENGLIDKVRIAADEPSDKKLYGEVLEFLKLHTPSFRYKAAINHVDFIEESKGRIDDYVLYLQAVSENWEAVNSIRVSIKGRLLWYICCEPLFPNTFISSPLAECRLMGILTAFMNFDGFLRWNYTAWPEKPRERISYNYPLWKAGDTNFVYPSGNGRPLITLRYKALKRGIEDYELITILKKKHPDFEAVMEKVYEKLFNVKDKAKLFEFGLKPEELYSIDYSDYEGVREYLLDEISELRDRDLL